MHAYETAGAAHQGLARYLMFYNQTRPHQALDGQTPDQAYSDNLTTRRTAAKSATRQAPLKEWSSLSNQPGPPLFLVRRSLASPIRLGTNKMARPWPHPPCAAVGVAQQVGSPQRYWTNKAMPSSPGPVREVAQLMRTMVWCGLDSFC